MPSEELRMFQGGLMRCCIRTLYEKHDAGLLNVYNKQGSEIVCKWCGNGMVKSEQGIWSWDHGKALNERAAGK